MSIPAERRALVRRPDPQQIYLANLASPNTPRHKARCWVLSGCSSFSFADNPTGKAKGKRTGLLRDGSSAGFASVGIQNLHSFLHPKHTPTSTTPDYCIQPYTATPATPFTHLEPSKDSLTAAFSTDLQERFSSMFTRASSENRNSLSVFQGMEAPIFNESEVGVLTLPGSNC